MSLGRDDRDLAEATILDWLGHLYDNINEGWLSLFAVDRASGDRHVDWVSVEDYDAFAAAAPRRAPT